MTRLALALPDAEAAAVALAKTMVSSPVTVGVAVPDGWKLGTSPVHVLVAQDGASTPRHRITSKVTLRFTVFASATSAAKAAASALEARLCAHPGGDPISSVTAGAGLITTRDTSRTNAELASFTVIATVRTTPLA